MYARVKDKAKADARFAQILADPFQQIPDRSPIDEEIECLVVGAGFLACG